MSRAVSETPTRVLIQRVIPPYKVDLIRRLANEFSLFVIHARQSHRATVSDVGDIGAPNRRTWRIYAPGRESVVVLGGLLLTLRLQARTVVLEGSLGILTNYVYLLLKRVLGVRVVLWTFGFDPDRGSIGTGLKDRARLWSYRRCDAVIVYSHSGRAKLVDADSGLADKTFVALNVVGADLVREGREVWRDGSPQEARRYLGFVEGDLDTPTVVFVGRLIPEKRVDVLIEATARSREQGRDLRCYIVGDGPERAALETLSRRFGVDDVVRFVGHVPPRDTAAWLVAADLIAVPGRLGLVVSHAAAFGAPVLSVRAEGFHGEGAEFLVDDVTGWWCESYGDYASDLDTRLQDRAGLAAVKRESMRYFEQHLNEDEAVRGFGDALDYAEREVRS